MGLGAVDNITLKSTITLRIDMSIDGVEVKPEEKKKFKVYGSVDINSPQILLGEVTLPADISPRRSVHIPIIKLFDGDGAAGADEFSVNNELNRLKVEHIEVVPVTINNEWKIISHYLSKDFSANRLISENKYKLCF